jgi:hypothetical protein
MGFFAGHVFGELVDEQTALPEIRKCKLIEEKQSADEKTKKS